jgi:hypothetical protein
VNVSREYVNKYSFLLIRRGVKYTGEIYIVSCYMRENPLWISEIYCTSRAEVGNMYVQYVVPLSTLLSATYSTVEEYPAGSPLGFLSLETGSQ